MSTIVRKEHGKTSINLITVRIGKREVTASFIEEVSKNLDKRGEVRVRILKTGLSNRTVKEIAKDVANATGSSITYLRGHTFTLRKLKNPKKIFIRHSAEYSR